MFSSEKTITINFTNIAILRFIAYRTVFGKGFMLVITMVNAGQQFSVKNLSQNVKIDQQILFYGW